MSSNNNISIYDARGYFHTTVSVLDEEVADVLIDENSVGCVEGWYDGSTHWFDGSNVVPRPNMVVPATKQVQLGTQWAIPGLPAGTKVTVDGAYVGATEVEAEPLLFEEAGEQVLTLEPFPYKPVKVTVTVL